jgi:hypothetical protein
MNTFIDDERGRESMMNQVVVEGCPMKISIYREKPIDISISRKSARKSPSDRLAVHTSEDSHLLG